MQFNNKQAYNIEEKYSKHKGSILAVSELTAQTVIHGIKYSQGKLVFFNYSANVKY